MRMWKKQHPTKNPNMITFYSSANYQANVIGRDNGWGKEWGVPKLTACSYNELF